MNDEVKQLLLDCQVLFEMEYGDKWKILSNDSKLKQTMLKLKEVLGEE